jgi:hypothetical protein
MMRTIVMLACAAVLAATHGALAQSGSRTIRGMVVDSASQKPLPQAVVYFARTPTGHRTGNDGTFRVPADSGPVVLMIRRWGYVPVLIPVPPTPGDSLSDIGTTAMHPVKTDADRAAVQNIDLMVFPELREFYDRKASFHQGLFFTPDELLRAGGSLFTLIRQKPGFRYICYVDRKGDVDCGQESSRGRTSIMNPNPTSPEQQPCLIHLWSNGLGPQKTLDQVQLDEVLAVEAYRSPGVTPPVFAGSPCAAIMLWMKPTAR